MSPGAGLDRREKFRSHRDSIPGTSSPWRVAIHMAQQGNIDDINSNAYYLEINPWGTNVIYIWSTHS